MKLGADSILVLDASPFGRSLDLVPSLSAVRAACPTVYVAAAASAGICDILTSCRLVDKAVSLGAIKPSDKGFAKSLLRVLRLSRAIGSADVDLVLDFSPSLPTLFYGLTKRARIVTATTGAGRRAVRTTARRLSMSAVPPDSYADILDQIGLRPSTAVWAHLPLQYESSRFEETLARAGCKGGEPILLVYTMEPGWPRSWQVHNYLELASRLAANYGVRVVAADSPYTSDFTNTIGPSLPKESVKLRAPRALELIAALARSSVVVTDDSGFARMAGRLGTAAIDLGMQSPSNGYVEGRPASRDIETVYQTACHLLQTSRTATLFRD